MTAHGFRRTTGARGVDGRAIEDAERAETDEWAILVRPRHSRRAYVRQIVIDLAVVLAALVIITLLS